MATRLQHNMVAQGILHWWLDQAIPDLAYEGSIAKVKRNLVFKNILRVEARGDNRLALGILTKLADDINYVMQEDIQPERNYDGSMCLRGFVDEEDGRRYDLCWVASDKIWSFAIAVPRRPSRVDLPKRKVWGRR